MEKHRGKVVLITGASSGIGRASAELLAANGAKVIINYRTNEEGALAAKDNILRRGGECIVVQADVSKKAEADRLVETGLQEYGQIDVLVNNAGSVIKRSPFLEIGEELWDKTFHVNVKSMYLVSQAVLNHMVKRKKGKIINISSVAAKHGAPGENIHYAAAKGAVNTFTVGLAKEFAPYGILVNAVAPGFILTPFQEKYSTQERIDRIIPTIPLKRAGTAEDIAAMVSFLASEEADYITGEIFTVSGGR